MSTRVDVYPADHALEILVYEAGMVFMHKLQPNDPKFETFVHGNKFVLIREKPKE